MYGRRKAKPIGFSSRDDPRRLVIRREESNPLPPELITVGVHYIVDLDNVEKDLVTDNDKLTQICDQSLENGEATILDKMIHHFEPHGLTLLYLLAESHFSMHTWPEHQKIRIDFFTCEQNESKCISVIDHLKSEFESTTMKINILRR
jgi:S-adenosylmethionine decarboxylase